MTVVQKGECRFNALVNLGVRPVVNASVNAWAMALGQVDRARRMCDWGNWLNVYPGRRTMSCAIRTKE